MSDNDNTNDVKPEEEKGDGITIRVRDQVRSSINYHDNNYDIMHVILFVITRVFGFG